MAMRGVALRLVLPAGAVALWGGLAEAARHFPGEFDWRYMTLSRLLSARDNPTGYPWAVAAIEACGLAILLWSWLAAAAAPHRLPSPGSASRAEPGSTILRSGSALMMAMALVPLRLPRLPKLHEVLTVLAFIGLCLGV